MTDCSANFGGACLSNKLLSGSDLTSQLAGVLLRFRSEEVAFMGAIEAMFYQVQGLDKQRGFLRYLWWESNNLKGDLVDCEMCVHVFAKIIYLFIYLFVYLFIYLFICLFVCLFVCLFIYLFIYLFRFTYY